MLEAARLDVEIRYIGALVVAQAYADDQLIIVPGNSSREIEAKWRKIRKACTSWELESNGRYNQAKTEVMFMEKDYKTIRPPVNRLQNGGQAVVFTDKIKYLGIVFDRKGNFGKQSKAVRAKTTQLANKIAKRVYGRKSAFIRRVVDSVVKPAVRRFGAEELTTLLEER